MLGRVLYQMSAAYSLNNVHKHVMRAIPSWVAVASMSNLEEASMINLNTHTNPENSHKTSPLQLSYITTESLEFVDPPCFVHSPVDKMNHGMIYLFL
jgi:hypothetical protein